MNIITGHTQYYRTDWRGRLDCQMGRFFGLSFLLHLCFALLFVAYADQAMSKHHQEVLYIDLSQPSLPIAAPPCKKSGPAEVKKPQRAQVPAPPARIEPPPQPIKAPSQPMQQTVFSESAKPSPMTNARPVNATFQGNPQPTTAGSAGPQAQGSAQTSTAGNRTANPGPPGEMEFGSASGPSFMQRVMPAYPMVARRFNKEGKVVLRLTINEYGSLINVEVLEDPGYGLASAAVEAVKKSRYNPAHFGGRPVMAKAILPVRFTLQGVN
jgi:protein TonB